MPNDRHYERGQNQDLFIGGAARRKPATDMDEGTALRIAAQCQGLGFRDAKVLPTKNLKGQTMGYAVQYRDEKGNYIFIGTEENFAERKRELLRKIGMVLG